MASDSRDFDEYRLPAVVNRDPYFVIHDFSDEWLPAELRRPGSVQRWERKKELGRGTFGTVWLEVLRSGKPTGPEVRAVKTVPRKLMRDERELAAMTDFSRRKYVHTGSFVEFFGWFRDAEAIYIAMEYFPHGTLSLYIGQGIPENEVRKITGQLLVGLALMHAHDYAHRDLKPDNIFIDTPGPEWSVKIGDFGVSKRATKELTAYRTATGTPVYQAPEIQGDVELENEEEYTNIVDMWSLGCVVFEMAARTKLFPKWPWDYKKLCWGRWYPDKPHGLSQKGWDFITKLLVPNPTGRLSAVEALKHEWIASRDSQPLTGEVVKGPEAAAPPPMDTPGLDSEEFRHTVTPSRPARFSELPPEPPVADEQNRDERFGRPVDTNSIKVERSQGNPPTNVPGAGASRTRTSRVRQSGNSGKIQAGNGYDNDALSALSTKPMQVMPSIDLNGPMQVMSATGGYGPMQVMSSSGEHGNDDLSASSQRRTVVRRAGHANIGDVDSADDSHHAARASFIQDVPAATKHANGNEPATKPQHATIVRGTVQQPTVSDDIVVEDSDDEEQPTVNSDIVVEASDDEEQPTVSNYHVVEDSDDEEFYKALWDEPLPAVATSKIDAAHAPSTGTGKQLSDSRDGISHGSNSANSALIFAASAAHVIPFPTGSSVSRVNVTSPGRKGAAQPSSEAAENGTENGYGIASLFEERPETVAAMNGYHTHTADDNGVHTHLNDGEDDSDSKALTSLLDEPQDTVDQQQEMPDTRRRRRRKERAQMRLLKSKIPQIYVDLWT